MKKVLLFLLFALGVQIASAQVQQVPKEFEGLWIKKSPAYEQEGHWAPPRTLYLRIKNLPDGISLRGKIKGDAYVCKSEKYRGECIDKEVLYYEFTDVYYKDGSLYGRDSGLPVQMYIEKEALIVKDLMKIYGPYGFFGTFYNANDNW